MRWSSLLAVAAILLVALLPAAADAASTVTTNHARDSIVQQLGPTRSHALLIGIDQFDDAAVWHGLPGVDKEIKDVGAALEAQGFDIAPESLVGH
ncbi:MAG TPA: hypothetical protein VHZ56_02375, partial [Devosia sp.]|nr:hypothetical protein [Devosia sp.]